MKPSASAFFLNLVAATSLNRGDIEGVSSKIIEDSRPDKDERS